MRRKKLILSLIALVASIALWRIWPPEVLLWLSFPRDHETAFSKERRAAWNKEFGKIGLANPPKDIRWRSDTPFDGEYGRWSFETDSRSAQTWLADSRSIRNARADLKPDRRAYMFCMPLLNRANLVTMRELGDEQASVEVTTTDISDKGAKIDSKACEEAYRGLASLLEDMDVIERQHRSRHPATHH